jgi:hypothetical protein
MFIQGTLLYFRMIVAKMEDDCGRVYRIENTKVLPQSSAGDEVFLPNKLIQRILQIGQRPLIIILLHRLDHAALQMILKDHPSNAV